MFAAEPFEPHQDKKIFSPFVSCCSWIIYIILPYHGSEVPDAEIHPRDSVFVDLGALAFSTPLPGTRNYFIFKFFKNTSKWRRLAHCIWPKEEAALANLSRGLCRGSLRLETPGRRNCGTHFLCILVLAKSSPFITSVLVQDKALSSSMGLWH